ncbi:efflux RND transporter periplasmic adaptor subunit [Balneola sp. MJW-20]|uniref:efflux RND transporter periplasmic adaptor subunit n=1 Tax=Gracilimonas aurantiaca TaxID=3234185 RepID=UPI003467DFA2
MKTRNLIIYTGLIFGGLLIGYLIFGGSEEPQTLDEHIAESHTNAEGEIVYTCSMHPQVRQNEPGNCPICGMELIRAADAGQDESGALSENAISFSQAALALADIQTTPVRMARPVSESRLPGKVVVNQKLVSNVTAHFPGRVRELYVDYMGDYVRKGQKLASIYSPELITAQRELLETVRYKEQNPRLYEAARRKLILWEFPVETIDQIERSGEVMEELDFFSPVSGYVSQINISREDHINVGSMLYRIADLSEIWLEFEAYEAEVSQLEQGDEIRFTVSSLPGQSFAGEVNFIEPFLDEESRTVNVRVTAENDQVRMKPGMYAEGIVVSEYEGKEQLMVPRSAVLWTGSRSVVFVDVSTSDTPAFEGREVVLGNRAGESYVILSGLEEGEEVVTNGTFKVDAAAQLSDKLSMMNREPGTGANRGAHDHSSMNMNEETSNPVMDHSEHQMDDDSLSVLVPEYLKLRKALTLDQFEEARQIMTIFSDERYSDIEGLRADFKALSEDLIKRIEEEGYEGTLYKQFCPMYDGGSSWISDEEDIANPFYGSMMHNCGETVEKIN